MGHPRRYKLVEISSASRTVNRADLTHITKRTGMRVLRYYPTIQKAHKALLNTIIEDEKSLSMNLAMCGGDSELMGPQPIIEYIIIDRKTGKVYQIGGMHELYIAGHERDLDKMFSKQWAM